MGGEGEGGLNGFEDVFFYIGVGGHLHGMVGLVIDWAEMGKEERDGERDNSQDRELCGCEGEKKKGGRKEGLTGNRSVESVLASAQKRKQLLTPEEGQFSPVFFIFFFRQPRREKNFFSRERLHTFLSHLNRIAEEKRGGAKTMFIDRKARNDHRP